MASPNKALTGLVSKVLKLSLNKSKSKPTSEMLNEASKVKDSTKAYNNELEGLKKNYNEFNNPPVKMVSPLNGAYENPRFVDTERGQTASNIASKALLDGAIKKFNDPGVKSKRQAKRVKTLENRIKRKEKKYPSYSAKELEPVQKAVDAMTGNLEYKTLADKVFNNLTPKKDMSIGPIERPSRVKNKISKLKARSLKLKGKSDANKMIAEQKAKYAGLTANQARLLDKDNENKAKDQAKNNYYKQVFSEKSKQLKN